MLGDLTKTIRDGHWGNVHAVIVIHSGSLVYEEYFSGTDERLGRSLGEVVFDAEMLHDVRSISKTVTATLVGIARDRGEIPSLDLPLAEFLPRYAELLESGKREITLRHVLTMTAGLEWDEESTSYLEPENDERRLSASSDPVAFVLGREQLSRPGDTFNYSGGLTHVLAAVLEESTGEPLDVYADTVLFEPLGIERWEWMQSGSARPSAFSGLRLRARDLAKLGQLYLDGGVWSDTPVVSRSWVDEAIVSHVSYEDGEAPGFVLDNGYGFQWWTNRYETEHGFVDVATAIGNGEQRMIIVPELSLVVAMLAGNYNTSEHEWTPERILLDHIIPALPPNEDASF